MTGDFGDCFGENFGGTVNVSTADANWLSSLFACLSSIRGW